MGIFTSSKLMVGLPMDDLRPWLQAQVDQINASASDEEYPIDIGGLIEVEFDYASPYYDSDMQDWIVGFEVPSGRSVLHIHGLMQRAAAQFKALTGLEAYVYSSPHVT